MSQALAPAHGRGSLQIPSLDGLRTVSFLMVFMGHIGLPGVPGGFGVTVFFFLSGYLITTLLRLEIERTGRIDFKLFYLRRVLRIWPPFYLVLFSACMLTVFLGFKLSASSVLALGLHYGNYWMISAGADGIPGGTGVYWSLAVEEHFYLVFPALYLLLVRSGLSPKKQQLSLFALCAATLVWRVVLINVLGSSFNRTYMASDTRLDSMLFGCCLAVYGNPALDSPEEDRPNAKALFGLALGVALLIASFAVRADWFRATFRYTLQGIGLYPVFVTAVRFPNWGPYRVLNLRFMKFLGGLSYSLYLVHQIVIMWFFDHLPAPIWILIPVCLAISVAISTLIWRFIEEPCGEIRKRLSAAARPVPKPSSEPVPERLAS